MSKNQQYFVYLVSNYKRNVLYTGITNNLVKRVFAHKKELVKGFTAKYKVHYLLYFEIFDNALLAIEREKQIKRWSRKKKNVLIAKMNPTLKDFYPTII